MNSNNTLDSTSAISSMLNQVTFKDAWKKTDRHAGWDEAWSTVAEQAHVHNGELNKDYAVVGVDESKSVAKQDTHHRPKRIFAEKHFIETLDCAFSELQESTTKVEEWAKEKFSNVEKRIDEHISGTQKTLDTLPAVVARREEFTKLLEHNKTLQDLVGKLMSRVTSLEERIEEMEKNK